MSTAKPGRVPLYPWFWDVDQPEHRDTGHIGDHGVYVSGVIGTGKGAGVKSLVMLVALRAGRELAHRIDEGRTVR